jgi:hypothetical protein
MRKKKRTVKLQGRIHRRRHCLLNDNIDDKVKGYFIDRACTAQDDVRNIKKILLQNLKGIDPITQS